MSWVKGIPPKIAHERFGIYHGQWMPEMDRCWCDYERGYMVCSRLLSTENFGNVEHVTITKMHDKSEVKNTSAALDILSVGAINPATLSDIVSTGGSNPIGWNEKMQIKNELFGEDRFAIEVYPKQDKLVDVCDVYHLWVFPKGVDMPFGIHPTEYEKSKAVNRKCEFTPGDASKLQKAMKKSKFS